MTWSLGPAGPISCKGEIPTNLDDPGLGDDGRWSPAKLVARDLDFVSGRPENACPSSLHGGTAGVTAARPAGATGTWSTRCTDYRALLDLIQGRAEDLAGPRVVLVEVSLVILDLFRYTAMALVTASLYFC